MVKLAEYLLIMQDFHTHTLLSIFRVFEELWRCLQLRPQHKI